MKRRALKRRYGRSAGTGTVPGLAKWDMFSGGTSARDDQRSYGLHLDGKQYSIGAVGHPRRGYVLTVFPSPQHGHGWITPDGNSHSYPHPGSFYRSPVAAVSAAKKFHRFYGGA